MNTQQLLYFLDVTQTGSMSKTAEHFYTSSQAVANALNKLELEFQEPFLVRTTRGVVLTEAGERFAKQAAQWLTLYDSVFPALQTSSSVSPSPQTLTIGVHPRVFQHIFINVLEQFQSLASDVTLNVLELTNQSLFQKLANAQLDFALLFIEAKVYQEQPLMLFNNANQGKQISLEKIFQDNLVLCTAANSRYAKNEPLTTADIKDIPVIFYEHNYDLFFQNPPSLDIDQGISYFSSNSAYAHRRLVSYDLACEILTRYEYNRLYQHDRKITAHPVPGLEPSVFALAYLKNDHLNPSISIFREILSNMAFPT